jgi:hypothetical protein
LAAGALAGITYSRGGGWGFDSDAFSESLVGNAALASYASGMASTFATGAMGALDLRDANEIKLGDKVFDTKSIGKFNGVAGSLAGQGVNYAITGEASFNVLNSRDIAQLMGMEWSGAGMLEMRIGGSGGFSMKVGQGGADISATLLASSFVGMIEAGKIGGAKAAALFGSLAGVSTLDAVNMLGYAADLNNLDMAKKLWSGKAKAAYSDDMAINPDGAGRYGSYDAKDPATILLSADLLGVGKEKAALLASVMSHEGEHMNGGHMEGSSMVEQLRTYATLLDTFKLQGNQGYVNGTLFALANPAAWMENGGDVDHLTITKDGGIKRDGDNRQVNFEDGRPSIAVIKPGFQSGIEQYFGLASGTGYQELLKGLGYSYDGASWSGPATVSKADIEKALADGKISKDTAAKVLGELDDTAMSPLDTIAAAYIKQERQRSDMTLSAGKQIIQALAAMLSQKKQGLQIQEPTRDWFGDYTGAASGDGSLANPYVTQDQRLISMNDLAARFGMAAHGPCLISAALDFFAIQGKSPDQVLRSFDRYRADYVSSDDGTITKDPLDLFQKMGANLGTPAYPSYVYDAKGFPVTLSQDEFLKSGYTMALMAAWRPGSTGDPDHWLPAYKSGNKWYVDESWRKDSPIPGRWGQSDWKIIPRTYRPIMLIPTKK